MQGFLRKGDGTAIPDGSYSLVIGVLQNNSIIWAKSFSSVAISKGVFSQSLSGSGSNLNSLSASTGMNSDFSLVTLSPSLLQNANAGSIKIRIYASAPIDSQNPQFDLSVQSVPSAFVSQIAQSVTAGSISLNSISSSVYSQSSSASKLLQLNSYGKLDPSVYGTDIPAANISGVIASSHLSLAASDIPSLDAGKITTGTFSTSRIDVGTSANKILQLDSAAKIPAVNGSQLTNLSFSQLSGTLPISKGGLGSNTLTANTLLMTNGTGSAVNSISCATGQLLKWSGTAWACQSDAEGTGTVSEVTASAPLSVTNGTTTPDISLNLGSGLINSSGQLAVDSGTSANKILALDGNARIPAVDGSQVTQLNASNLASGSVSSSLLPVAGASADGIINTSAQTISGNKTFSGNSTFNGSSTFVSTSSFAGAATFSNTVSVSGSTTLSGNIIVNGIGSSTSTSFINGSQLVPTSPVMLLKATTAIALTCIQEGTNGQMLDIIFVAPATGTNATVTNNGTCTSPAAKIFTNTAGTLTISTGLNHKGSLRLIYLDSATSGLAAPGWFVLSSAL